MQTVRNGTADVVNPRDLTKQISAKLNAITEFLSGPSPVSACPVGDAQNVRSRCYDVIASRLGVLLLVVVVTFGRRRESVCLNIPRRAIRLDPEICADVMSLQPEFTRFMVFYGINTFPGVTLITAIYSRQTPPYVTKHLDVSLTQLYTFIKWLRGRVSDSLQFTQLYKRVPDYRQWWICVRAAFAH